MLFLALDGWWFAEVRGDMATRQQLIAEKVLANLAESNDVDASKIERLKTLLAEAKSLSTPDQNQQINDVVV